MQFLRVLFSVFWIFGISFLKAQGTDCPLDDFLADLAGASTDKEALRAAVSDNPRLVKSWDFLDGSPNIRTVVANLDNMDEVLEAKIYEVADISIEQLKAGINNSNSKAKMIERLKEASGVNSGSSVENFLDAFATAGKEIDHKMTASVSSLDEAFSTLDKSTTSPDFEANWASRQSAVSKQEKIVASEALAESRVDQIYENKGWQRLDIDDVPPGKQGKFDRVYAKFDEDGDLLELHVIEAKGGGSTLGARKIADGSVAQQGTNEYKNDIINNLLQKLSTNDPLRKALVVAREEKSLSYILVTQKIDVKNNFDVKLFPLE